MAAKAKDVILAVMERAGRPLAVHEFNAAADPLILGISENSLSARLRELRQAGKVEAQLRFGKPFKEWKLIPQKEAPTAQQASQ